MRNIGKNVRQLREMRKLSQEELGEKLFVTRQTISNYETGRSRPDIETLVKLGEVLNVEIDELIYGPSTQEKARKRRFFFLCAGLVIMLGIALLILNPIGEIWKSRYIRQIPYTLLTVVLRPVFYLLLGGTVFLGLGVFFGLKPRRGTVALWGWRILLALVVLEWLAVLPYLWWQIELSILRLQGITEIVSSFGGGWETISLYVVHFHKFYPWLSFVPGALLCLLHGSSDSTQEET